MTTQAANAGAGGAAEYGLSFRRVSRSEWTKLLSLRSTWWVLGVSVSMAIGLAGVIGWAAERAGETPSVDEAVATAFLTVDGLSLVFGVFGVLLMTGEYSSGLVRATLVAVPRRLPVLGAKALILLAVTAPGALLGCVASFLLIGAFMEVPDGFSLGDPQLLRATLGAAAAPVALALMGLGIGTMLRHTAGALTTYAAALLVIPALLPAALPEAVEDSILPYVPTFAGQAMYEVGESEAFPWMLSPGPGGLVLAGWIAVLLAGGAAVLRRRDA